MAASMEICVCLKIWVLIRFPGICTARNSRFMYCRFNGNPVSVVNI